MSNFLPNEYGLMPTSVISDSNDTGDKDALKDAATVDSTDKGDKDDDNKDNNKSDNDDNDDDDGDDAAGCTLCGEWYMYMN